MKLEMINTFSSSAILALLLLPILLMSQLDVSPQTQMDGWTYYLLLEDDERGNERKDFFPSTKHGLTEVMLDHFNIDPSKIEVGDYVSIDYYGTPVTLVRLDSNSLRPFSLIHESPDGQLLIMCGKFGVSDCSCDSETYVWNHESHVLTKVEKSWSASLKKDFISVLNEEFSYNLQKEDYSTFCEVMNEVTQGSSSE